MKRSMTILIVLLSIIMPHLGFAKLGKALRIDAAGVHSCAIFEKLPGSKDTVVRCWGSEASSEENCPLCVNEVLKVPPLNQPREIKVSRSHACAIHEGGVKCWGLPGNHLVAPPIKNAVSLALNFISSCAIDNQSNLFCWGNDMQDHNHVCGPSPKADCLAFPNMRAKSVMLNDKQICIAGKTGDSLYCWNSVYRGYINTLDKPKGEIKSMAAGEIDGGFVLTDRQLKYIHSGNNILPGYIFSDEDKISEIGTGAYHLCIIQDGKILCRGTGVAAGVMDPPESIRHPTQIASGWRHNCVIDDGEVVCWGLDDANQLKVPKN